ncbi:hypothetical protein LUZ61_011236 [Rhynchospora tenuis]|uniref:Caffeoyl-CoA O-methyltransferase n=1 Tax=Rhynchospora tenuis TaxID=198213 RepID=A0AAD6F023_9POAL|nr:hypothetical protein LUZ61_011236 [Rhynchospora tenuis]
MEDTSAWSGPKSLLQSETLYQYILDTTVYPREPDCLKELRNVTANSPWYYMAVPPDEALFLSILLKLMNAKNTMEIGVFTGYSLLNTALAIPDDGKILAIDIDREAYEIGLPVIEKAGMARKIDFREGSALTILDQLLNEEKYKGLFDFVFVDADKDNYLNYHKRAIELVRVGGVIAYDNSLYSGLVVAPPGEPLYRGDTIDRDAIVELNKVLAADPRIEVCQLSIADGLSLCRRLY